MAFKFAKILTNPKKHGKQQTVKSTEFEARPTDPVLRTPVPDTPPTTASATFTTPPRQINERQRASRIYAKAPPQQQRKASGPATTLYQPSHAPQKPEYTVWNRIKLRDTPFPRYRHAAPITATSDNKVFLMGGLHEQSVYGDTWILTANANATEFNSQTIPINDNTPPPRVGHAVTLCGNAFVVFGGDTHKVNANGMMDDDVYLLNINSHKWTIPNPIGPRLLGRYGHRIAVIASKQMKTKLYVFGGQFDDTFYDDLSVLDLSSFRRPDSHWEFIDPVSYKPPALTNHTMVEYDGKLWVFGGDTEQGLINNVYMFDPTSNDWYDIESDGETPPPMQEHSATIYKNLMCVMGGKLEDDYYSNEVYFLNMSSLKWYKLPTFNPGIPQGRSGHTITMLNSGKILVMGGDKFDYALTDDTNYHTSDVNMHRGTILYTLDLNDLEIHCPGIFDVIDPGKVEKTSEQQVSLEKVAHGKAITPLNNQEEFLKPIGKAIHDDILTPQTNHEYVTTPEIDESVEQGTGSFLPTIKSPMKLGKSNTTSIKNNPLSPINESKKPTSPLPQQPLEKFPNNRDTKPNASLTSQHPDKPKDDSAEVGNSTVISDNTIDDSMTSEGDVGIATTTNYTSPQKVPPFNKVQRTMFDKPGSVSKTSPEILNEPIDLKMKSESASGMTTTGEQTTLKETRFIDKSIVDTLRNELQGLKKSAEAKAIKADMHIKQLEKELEELKTFGAEHATNTLPATYKMESDLKNSPAIDNMELEMRSDILEAQNHDLKEQVHDLESLLGERFMSLETLNELLKIQEDQIKDLRDQPRYKELLDELTMKYEATMEENKKLVERLKNMEQDYFSSISNYRQQIDDFIISWRSKGNKSTTEEKMETIGSSRDDGDKRDYDNEDNINENDTDPSNPNKNGDNNVNVPNHHQAVVTKLSKRLDQLLERSQELSRAKEKLASEKLMTESQKKEVHTEESTKEQKQIINNFRTSNLLQAELEKYKQMSTQLQNELNELKEFSASQTDATTIESLKSELSALKIERDELKGRLSKQELQDNVD